MAESVAITALSESLLAMLQREKFVVLSTVDTEGSPQVNAISWVYAVNETTVRFAVDQRSRIVVNIKENPQVTISLFGGGSLHAIYGKASIVADPLTGVPFKLTCLDIHISQVRDAMFYGSRISVEPEYEKTYDKRAAEKLDNQVFEAMKQI